MIFGPPIADVREVDWQPPAGDGSPAGHTRHLRERLHRQAAWSISAAVHAVVSVLVIVEIALALLFVPPLGGGARLVELAAATEPLELEAQPLATLPIELPPDPSAAAVTERQIAELAASQIDPQLAEQLLNSSEPAG